MKIKAGDNIEDLRAWAKLRWRVVQAMIDQGFYVDWRDDAEGLLIHFWCGEGQLAICGPRNEGG